MPVQQPPGPSLSRPACVTVTVGQLEGDTLNRDTLNRDTQPVTVTFKLKLGFGNFKLKYYLNALAA